MCFGRRRNQHHTIIAALTTFQYLHAYLGVWVSDYVNRNIAKIPDYRAHVAAVTLHLWRGAPPTPLSLQCFRAEFTVADAGSDFHF